MNSDYSCYVTIVNKTAYNLLLDSEIVVHGSYVSRPPNSIAPGTSIVFQLQGSNIGPVGYGGQGECKYKYINNGNTYFCHMTYACPHLTNGNYATINVTDQSLHVIAIPNPIPTGGHPVRIQFTFS